MSIFTYLFQIFNIIFVINKLFKLMLYNIFIDSIYYDFLNRFYSSYTKKILTEAWLLFIKLYPYVILGIITTSIIKVFLTKNKIDNFFKKNTNISIIMSSFLGIISPLGSYIVIPFSASLFYAGLPLPIIMSFLISSPLIDANLFILTAGAFGYKMAIARLISSLLIGIGAGYFFQILIKKNIINPNNVIYVSKFNFEEETQKKIDRNIDINIKAFFIETYNITKYVIKYFTLALILSALIKILTPIDFIMRIFSKNLFISVLISTSAGVPFYTCGGAAIPVVKQLYELGMPEGSVLAFFISGPITKISNLILLKTIFCNKLFYLYLLYGIFCAILMGIIYNLIII